MIPIEQFCECSEGSSFVTCDESFNIKSLIYGALKIKLAFKGSFLFIYLVICFIWAEKVNPILNFVFAHFWLKPVGQKQRGRRRRQCHLDGKMYKEKTCTNEAQTKSMIAWKDRCYISSTHLTEQIHITLSTKQDITSK